MLPYGGMNLLASHPCKTIYILLTMTAVLAGAARAQEPGANDQRDQQVKAFLESHKNQWRDLNVPASDGQLLYDIIIKNGYTRALEIGTSTGHSTIWIAWALSKTGGKLTTIEIDEGRHNTAMANLKEAGLSAFVDARLADAHALVRELEGPFDFVFSDADKGWYTNYFRDVSPKLSPGGCFTAHNVRPRGGMSGTRAYLEYVTGLEGYRTIVDNTGGGLAISYKE
jgi:caffeoyl-CoA O-methyltransferase